MVNLEELLVTKKFGQQRDERQDMRIVANAVDEYLNTYPAITSLEIDVAIHAIDKGPIASSLQPNHTYMGRVFMHLRKVLNYYYCSIPSHNAYLGGSQTFHHEKLGTAVKKLFTQGKEEVVLHYENRIGISRTNIFYKDEEKLKEYLRMRLILDKRVVHYLFK